jgi:YHS domain-containing protein
MPMDRDPVCGMTVDENAPGGTLTESGHTYRFCSAQCREKFTADPARYTASGRGTEGLERHEPPRTTTGNFTAPKFGSAGSGGLEFEPLPESHDEER